MYEIVRFHKEGPNTVVKTVTTLAEAQEWCQREDTHGDGWFDGYREVVAGPNVGKFQCPRCGGPIPNAEHVGEYPGAISRWDNDTEVCSQCGQDEAMAQFTVGMRRGADRTEVLHPTRGLVRWVNPPETHDGYGVGRKSDRGW